MGCRDFDDLHTSPDISHFPVVNGVNVPAMTARCGRSRGLSSAKRCLFKRRWRQNGCRTHPHGCRSSSPPDVFVKTIRQTHVQIVRRSCTAGKSRKSQDRLSHLAGADVPIRHQVPSTAIRVGIVKGNFAS